MLCLLLCGSAVAEPPAISKGLPLITPMRGTGKVAPLSVPTRFTFVVFGDNRPGEGEEQPETIKEIFAAMRELDPRPAFAISLGDIIEGKDPEDTTEVIEHQFADFLKLAKRAETPIFNAPGNHEMDDDNDVPSRRMHRIYRECVGESYGAFNIGNSRFICLNTENVPPRGTPAPKPPLEFSYVSDEQYRELAADLEASKDKTQIFIAMHYPLKPKDARNGLNPKDRDRLAKLLAKYGNIAYVLAAHEHLYYNPQDPENVSAAPGFKKGDATVHLISGGAGAPLYITSKWSFHHYLVFAVDGEKVSVEIKRLTSKGAKS
jgi:hypothetical protein